MKKLMLLSFAVGALFAFAPSAMAKKEISQAKVWFKDGTLYEGPLVKHWSTYAQKFTASGHNFHILPEDGKKSVKCESKQVDSILIVQSTHPDFKDSAMYVPMVDGRVPLNGPKKKTNKMMLRKAQGRNVDFCTLPFMGNCMRGLRNDDQLLEYWLVRFHDNAEAFVFYSIPIQKGCNKNVDYLKYFVDRIKDLRPGLAEAIEAKYFPDKETYKKMRVEVVEHPQEFVGFIDDYLSEHRE